MAICARVCELCALLSPSCGPDNTADFARYERDRQGCVTDHSETREVTRRAAFRPPAAGKVRTYPAANRQRADSVHRVIRGRCGDESARAGSLLTLSVLTRFHGAS